jgi:hypothetical protein
MLNLDGTTIVATFDTEIGFRSAKATFNFNP